MLRRLVAWAWFVLLPVGSVSAADPQSWLDDNLPGLIELYRHLHQHPELSFQEEQTAARIAAELKGAGCTVTTGIGQHGVVGILANGEGPRIMLRADLDGLPVTEATGLVYASQAKAIGPDQQETGVMHACGHDIHMTNLVGVARYLNANRDRWQGTVMFVGQPAEERGGGAQAMLKDGLFERFPKPELALAVHVDSTLPAGKVGYRAGYALANVDSCDILVRGRGGHGAYPHATIDPIVQAARLILDLQTIVSREIKPTEPAVISVGSIHGGTKHNVIGDHCALQLTIRSYSPAVRQHLRDAIVRKAKANAQSANAPEPKIEFSDGTPAMFNDEKLVGRLVPVFERILGAEQVEEAEPSMGGEDFSEYREAGVPIFMWWLGSVETQRLLGARRVGQNPPSLHSPGYYPDAEPTLRTGVSTMASAVLDLLPPRP